jgi:hypothetical protein
LELRGPGEGFLITRTLGIPDAMRRILRAVIPDAMRREVPLGRSGIVQGMSRSTWRA